MRGTLKKLSFRALEVTLILALLTLLWGPPVYAQQEPDNDDDAYDQTTCAGISEDEVTAARDHAVPFPGGAEDLQDSSSRDLGNDPYEFSMFPDNNFQLPFEIDFSGDGSSGSSFSFVPSYTQEEQNVVNSSFYDEPQVSVNLVNSTAEPGEEVIANLNLDTFAYNSRGSTNGYYAVTFVDGVFLNGVTAGASYESLEGLTKVVTDSGRPNCGRVNRAAQTDQDQDGMDDDWEIRYGLNPNDPADAEQDADRDGYFAADFLNVDGEVLNPAPAIEGGELGDGVFTNREEFIMGTDPQVADTDGDGFVDEADVVGHGQGLIKFLATKELSEGPYQLHVIVVGYTGKRNEDKQRMAKIDSQVEVIQARNDEYLEVDLSVSSDLARPGEVLIVEAVPRGTTRHDLLLDYHWLVDGLLQTEQSGLSRRIFEYEIPEETLPGTELDIRVEVINPDTGQLSQGRATIILGDNVILDFDPETVVRSKDVTVNALLTADQDVEDFLFKWYLDGTLLPKSSLIGASQFTFTVERTAGDSHQVDLEVYRKKDSELFGEAEQDLFVMIPEVRLELIPAQPFADQEPTVFAETKYFGSDNIFYDFELDREGISAAGPLITINSGTPNSKHQIKVTAFSREPLHETAANEVAFVTGPQSLALNTGGSDSNLMAGLISSIKEKPVFLAFMFGLVGIASVGMFTYRRLTLKLAR